MTTQQLEYKILGIDPQIRSSVNESFVFAEMLYPSFSTYMPALIAIHLILVSEKQKDERDRIEGTNRKNVQPQHLCMYIIVLHTCGPFPCGALRTRPLAPQRPELSRVVDAIIITTRTVYYFVSTFYFVPRSQQG